MINEANLGINCAQQPNLEHNGVEIFLKSNFFWQGLLFFHIHTVVSKEELRLKVIFFAVSVHKTQSKLQNATFLLVSI